MSSCPTGWPSFWQLISRANAIETVDCNLAMHRTALSCAHCDAHTGHVFYNGRRPTRLRYCMNPVTPGFLDRA